jgi:hypothetical protein
VANATKETAGYKEGKKKQEEAKKSRKLGIIKFLNFLKM